MRTCNVCKKEIRGLDFAGRCEDCFAWDVRFGSGYRLSIRERWQFRRPQAFAAGAYRPQGRVVRKI